VRLCVAGMSVDQLLDRPSAINLSGGVGERVRRQVTRAAGSHPVMSWSGCGGLVRRGPFP